MTCDTSSPIYGNTLLIEKQVDFISKDKDQTIATNKILSLHIEKCS